MYDGDQLSEGLSPDEYTYLEDGTSDVATGLASLGFIRAALGRKKRVWLTSALAGLVLFAAFAVGFPPKYQASTSLLLNPETSVGEVASTCCPASGPIYNEQTIAGSRAVATIALQKLGLKQDINSFLKTYSVTTLTDRMILITASSKSATTAVNEASAIASAYLQFRANLVESAQNLVNQTLEKQINQAEQKVKSIDTQISNVSAQPASTAQAAQLKKLRNASTQAALTVSSLQSTMASNAATAQAANDTIVQGSRVLNPASLVPPHSKVKRTIEYAALGFFAGLVLSMAIVILGALVSDRLRRRDDIAQALGAPIEVSAGPVGLSRWRSSGRGLGVARNSGVKRVVAYLDRAIPPASRPPASLAVVPVDDDMRVPAVCVASLALSCAERGMQVVVADLCGGAPAARLLGTKGPGVRTVTVQGTRVTVVVPERDDVIPTGPFQGNPDRTQASESLIDACASADLLLTLASLDPTLGAEHLSGWARGAVVMVTAGRSTAARIRAVGEMVRMAGMPFVSGALIGADKNDESLGATVRPIPGDERGLRSGVADLFAADVPANGRLSGRQRR